jgi:hypothetical protein
MSSDGGRSEKTTAGSTALARREKALEALNEQIFEFIQEQKISIEPALGPPGIAEAVDGARPEAAFATGRLSETGIAEGFAEHLVKLQRK